MVSEILLAIEMKKLKVKKMNKPVYLDLKQKLIKEISNNRNQ